MKVLFWTVFTVGFVACSARGIGSVLERSGGNWTAPAMIAGCVLGAGLLGLAASFATGVRPGFLATDRGMLIALSAAISLKALIDVGVTVTSHA